MFDQLPSHAVGREHHVNLRHVSMALRDGLGDNEVGRRGIHEEAKVSDNNADWEAAISQRRIPVCSRGLALSIKPGKHLACPVALSPEIDPPLWFVRQHERSCR